MKNIRIDFKNKEEQNKAELKAKKESISRGIKCVEYAGTEKGYLEYIAL